MIQWVYERAQKSTHLQNLIIATENKRIYDKCQEFGADVRKGDEPLVRAEMIDALISAMLQEETPMATLAIKIDDLSLLEDQNIVKVVTDKQGYALYFSRSPLPFQSSDYFFQHIGIYGYRRDFLLDMCQWPPSRLEQEEKLEQLRALENGHRVKVVFTHFSTLSVDTPQDIIMVEDFMKKEHHD